MRDPSEKKTVNKSLKMTENQCVRYETEAAEQGISFNQYVLNHLEHTETGLKPEIMVHIQNIVNEANAIADGDTDLRRLNKMNREAKKLWSLLK